MGEGQCGLGIIKCKMWKRCLEPGTLMGTVGSRILASSVGMCVALHSVTETHSLQSQGADIHNIQTCHTSSTISAPPCPWLRDQCNGATGDQASRQDVATTYTWLLWCDTTIEHLSIRAVDVRCLGIMNNEFFARPGEYFHTLYTILKPVSLSRIINLCLLHI